MAVESFLNPTDVKITVEKTVKRKPKIEELTTVESPGRPVSADNFEEKPNEEKKTKKKTAKAPKAESKKVGITKDTTLIITEKPQAAQKIANALGDARKYNEGGVSYFEVTRNGEKIVVASAVGHLYGLTYVKGQKGWPIFNVEWVPSYTTKTAAFTKKYFDLLKELAKRAKDFYVATDFDNEGEVIGWNVLRFICKQNTAKRMKFSTLTAPELEAAFDKPMPHLAWGNAYAGETRHILDWLYGINLSRALMSAIKKANAFRILSIGRVQGPALKIIVDREKEIEAFKSQPYWQIFANAKGIDFQHPEDIFDKKLVEKFKKIKEAVAETKKTEENVQPPTPFDLTTLQRESYRWYHISPSATLKLAQKLYLDGLISYPRTSSQKIPKEIEPKKILKKLEKQFPEAREATRAEPIEGKKSDPAHPSIYPTGEIKKMTVEEKKLYDLIAKRFISAFSPDAKTANKKITLTATGDIKFTANGLTILEKGWTKVYPHSMEEVKLPDMDGKVKIDEIKIEEKETQPPKRYSPASLITLLEKKNLGTKATRSSIVDTLFSRGYLDGTSIQATSLGRKLIDTLEKYSPIIIDEELTRSIEEEMEKLEGDKNVKEYEADEKKIVDKAKETIIKISEHFKARELEIGKELAQGIVDVREAQREASTLMQCPTCKQGNLRILYSKKSRRYFVACDKYPDCKQTYSLPPNSLIKKTEKVCEADNFPKLLALRKGKRPWEFCFNPNCPIEKAKREEWAAKKEAREEKEDKGTQVEAKSDDEEGEE